MHALIIPTWSNRVDLVNEQNCLAQLFRQIENLGELFLTFAVPFRHDAFNRHVNQRNLHLLGYNLGTCCFARPWRPLKQNSLWSVGFIFDSSRLSYLVVNLWIGKCKQNRIFDISFLFFVASEVVPVEIQVVVVRKENRKPHLLHLLDSLISSTEVRLNVWTGLNRLSLGWTSPVKWELLQFVGFVVRHNKRIDVCLGNIVSFLNYKRKRCLITQIFPFYIDCAFAG